MPDGRLSQLRLGGGAPPPAAPSRPSSPPGRTITFDEPEVITARSRPSAPASPAPASSAPASTSPASSAPRPDGTLPLAADQRRLLDGLQSREGAERIFRANVGNRSADLANGLVQVGAALEAAPPRERAQAFDHAVNETYRRLQRSYEDGGAPRLEEVFRDLGGTDREGSNAARVLTAAATARLVNERWTDTPGAEGMVRRDQLMRLVGRSDTSAPGLDRLVSRNPEQFYGFLQSVDLDTTAVTSDAASQRRSERDSQRGLAGVIQFTNPAYTARHFVTPGGMDNGSVGTDLQRALLRTSRGSEALHRSMNRLVDQVVQTSADPGASEAQRSQARDALGYFSGTSLSAIAAHGVDQHQRQEDRAAVLGNIGSFLGNIEIIGVAASPIWGAAADSWSSGERDRINRALAGENSPFRDLPASVADAVDRRLGELGRQSLAPDARRALEQSLEIPRNAVWYAQEGPLY